MRIRIPIHLAFWKIMMKLLKLMDDSDRHKTAEIVENLGLKDTRTKELLKELVGLEKLVDNGITKGKMYKLK